MSTYPALSDEICELGDLNVRLFMMRILLMVVTGSIMLMAFASASAQDVPKRSAELQVLDRYIGDWETVVTASGTDEKSTSMESRRWSREGKFVLSENHDSNSKQYRACFINEELTVPLFGKWDEKMQTMTWNSSEVAFKHHSIHRFIDKDHVEWTMTVTSPDGEVVLELSAKQTRRSK
jgi:hypothetical protein